jgi:hypothetical protein
MKFSYDQKGKSELAEGEPDFTEEFYLMDLRLS